MHDYPFAPAPQNHCSTEQAKTITDIRNLIGGMSLGVLIGMSHRQKKVSQKVSRITRFRPTYWNIF